MADRSGTPRHERPVRKIALVSLGCPKNQVDSELILGRLDESGLEIVSDPDDADTLVINTCAFIDVAREESIEALLDAVAWKGARDGRRVVAAGCLVQRSGAELARELPELDGMIGLDDIPRAGRIVSPARALPAASLPSGPATGRAFEAAAPRLRLSRPWSAYLKIAEGCDQSCAFCAIPTFRGRMRSRPAADVVDELGRLAREGVLEANLVAQDSTGWGRDIGERGGLAALVRAIDEAESAPPWVRIHYLYPGRISGALVAALRESRRIVEYVDLPLQHADPEILRRMRRPGSAESYLDQLEALRDALPDAAVRSGFIVGFPGESEAAFETLMRFVERARFDALGVFTYSHEQGTPAADLADDVLPATKRERREALEELAASVSWQRGRERIGARLDVLVEDAAGDAVDATGRWRGQAPEVDGRVVLRDGAGIEPGRIVPVVVEEAGPHELVARLAPPGGTP